VTGEGIAVVSREGELLHCNAALLRLARAADGDLVMAAVRRVARAAAATHAAARTIATRPGLAEMLPLTAVVRTRAGVSRLRAACAPAGAPLPEGTVLVAVQASAASSHDPAAVRQRLGLPRRVAEVAVLLAERATNAEVALRLGISPYTARRHTERVLAALGVTVRTDVAAALERAMDEHPRDH